VEATPSLLYLLLLLLLLLWGQQSLLLQVMRGLGGGRGEGRAGQGAAADGPRLLLPQPPAGLQTPLLLPWLLRPWQQPQLLLPRRLQQPQQHGRLRPWLWLLQLLLARQPGWHCWQLLLGGGW
jgi:hypothetical protein